MVEGVVVVVERVVVVEDGVVEVLSIPTLNLDMAALYILHMHLKNIHYI